MCNDVVSTKTVYSNGAVSFRFHNLITNQSLYFYNCVQYESPVDDSCSTGRLSPAMCKMTKNKSHKLRKNPKKIRSHQRMKTPKSLINQEHPVIVQSLKPIKISKYH